MAWKNLSLFWFCCQIDSTGCFEKSIGCFFENLNKILLSCFKWFQQLLVFDLTVLTTWLEYKNVVLCSYALTKKERSINFFFQDIKELLDHLKRGVGLSCIFWTLIFDLPLCILFPSFLNIVFLCFLVWCSFRRCFWKLCGLPKVVCVLEGFKIITFSVCFVI